MKRRLIKIPLLTWIFIVTLFYNIYQIIYPNSIECDTSSLHDVPAESKLYIFTSIPNHQKSFDLQMIRRQFKHRNGINSTKDENYNEIFLNQFGKKVKNDFGDDFQDTIYTTTPFMSTIDEIWRKQSGTENNQFYIFFDKPFFDIRPAGIMKIKSAMKMHANASSTLFCLDGISNGTDGKSSCKNDFFGFKYQAVDNIRKAWLTRRDEFKLLYKETNNNTAQLNQTIAELEKKYDFITEKSKLEVKINFQSSSGLVCLFH